MGDTRHKSGFGFTIIELMVTITIVLILAPVIGVLFVGGHRAWSNTYNSAHKKVKTDAEAVMLAFGNAGRRSNRSGYIIYNIEDGCFTAVEPEGTEAEEVVFGDAVEFRCWDAELDSEDTYNLMDNTKTATAYALFYVDGNKLLLDRGPYPPGAVPIDGGEKNSNDVITTVLAENVSTDPNAGAFSHSPNRENGGGCIRINITLTDPEDPENPIRVMTATLMRNEWPR